jgi:ectoine hydroxylase-related dioxygenase (phytanoyl-CoA dioxygenase family)
MPLSADQIQQFADTGVVVLRGFFDQDEVAAISAHLDRLRDTEPGPGREARYYEESPLTGESVLVRVENVVGEHSPDFTRRVIPPRAVAALTRLFGETPVLFKDKVNYKEPGCRPDKLHQDQAAGWNRYTDFFVTMAIAVDPCRADNAALSFMTSGNYRRELMCEEWQPLSEADPPYEPAADYTLMEADPGDVLLFDSYVPHGSPANTGNRGRRMVFLTFNRASAGDFRARYYADKWASYAPNKAQEARTLETFRV